MGRYFPVKIGEKPSSLESLGDKKGDRGQLAVVHIFFHGEMDHQMFLPTLGRKGKDDIKMTFKSLNYIWGRGIHIRKEDELKLKSLILN